jgi:hypothetical protein
VEIDRPVADDASAWERDGGLVLAAKQRAEDANGGAHFADDVVGGLGGDFFRAYLDGAAGAFDFASELAQDGEHVVDVAQVGNARDRAGFLGEEGGGKYWQSRVF